MPPLDLRPAVYNAPPVELTAEQRERLIKILTREPWTGIVAAARSVGVRGSRGQIRAAVRADPDIRAAVEEARHAFLDRKGLTVERLIEKLSDVVESDANPSQLRAIQLGLGLHGIAPVEARRVEVSGPEGEPVQTRLRVEHEHRLTVDDLVAYARERERERERDGVAGPGSGAAARGELPAARPVLPASDVG